MNVNTIQICPNCQQFSKTYDSIFDFWQCQICYNVWSDGLNDPDFEDDVPQAREAIAERNIEIINQWQPNT
jgi:ribosomal protein L37AE/L43A